MSRVRLTLNSINNAYVFMGRYKSLKSEMDQLREVYRNMSDDNHNIKMMYEAKCEELSKVGSSPASTVTAAGVAAFSSQHLVYNTAR